MPIDAVHNAPLNEYRCGMTDCHALLLKGNINAANIVVKCKCGCINLINVVPPVVSTNPGYNTNGALAYQDRLNLARKNKRR